MEAQSRQRGRNWGEWLALLLLAGVVLGVPLFLWAEQSAQAVSSPLEVRVVARRFEDGGWSPNVIRVRAGQKVRLRLASEDVTHGFLVPSLGVSSGPIIGGQETVVELTVMRPGVYPFYCNVLCSHRHGAMVGRIIAY